MTQQLSPWLETAYGWSYGESGWNSGMDSNLLKFSVMFDRNVDSIVTSLPPAVNGQVHYNTSDNRLYFAVNTTYFSTPVPKWFIVIERSTGVTWQFNGSALFVVESASSLDSRLDAVELTISNLGSAAFEDVSAFATQAALDISEAQAQAYTDVLRNDLSSSQGTDGVGYGTGTLTARIQEVARPYDTEFQAVGDGVADDTAAVLACLSDGRPIYLGGDDKVYRITEELAFTALRSVVIHSDGAKIIVDSPSSIRSALRIDLAGNSAYISGELEIDANSKSFSGLYMSNFGAAVPEANYFVSGVTVRNPFRASTTFTGGDGIFIAGRVVGLIDRCYVYNVRMAAGAGVSGSQGVAGIVVARDNTNGWDSKLTRITNCVVGPVYCDDIAYTFDQDGIKLFTNYNSAGDNPQQVFGLIDGCRFINCMGRAIKIQSEFVSVDNIKIERNGDIHSSYTGNPDIDFQVGGGQVSNVQCHYRSNFPSRVVQASMTQTDTRLNPTSVSVMGLSVSQAGSGAGIDRVLAVSTEFDAICQVSLSAVSLFGSKSPTNFVTLQSQVVGGRFAVNVQGIIGRSTGAFVTRLGSVLTPCHITGISIINQGTSVAFASPFSAGDFTVSLLGANHLVT